MTTNPDSIESFLRSLGPQLENLWQPQQSQERGNLQVRVMLAKLPNSEYVVHCFVLERGITETDLEGQLLRGQWTFRIESLAKFSELYEEMLEGFGINYHRSVSVRPGPSQNVVSYRLVDRLGDPLGHSLLQSAGDAITVLHNNHNNYRQL
ncbi:MAG: hypothetical protein AABX69_03350 [Nanoarchaeota archaeon]